MGGYIASYPTIILNDLSYALDNNLLLSRINWAKSTPTSTVYLAQGNAYIAWFILTDQEKFILACFCSW